MTADELRKVYDSVAANRQAEAHGAGFDTVHGDALLAVARHVAQRQRDMEPTAKMRMAGCIAIKDIYAKEGGWCGIEAAKDQMIETYLAMQRAAPLVTDTPGGSDDSV